MNNLISGKEALIALVNGEEVENFNGSAWWNVDESWEVGAFLSDRKFRLKPRTIRLNGIEVPAPFKPKEGERYWFMSTSTILGYAFNDFESDEMDDRFTTNGAWRTEDEIKKVVTALRQVFGGV